MNSFDREWQRWFQKDGDRESPTPPQDKRKTAGVFLILGAALALFILMNVAKGFYTEWLWFSSLGYGSVYTTILKTKVLVFFSAAIIF